MINNDIFIKNEHSKILHSIDKLLKSNSEIYKIRKYIFHIYPKNEYLSRYYNSLVDLNNNDYKEEVIKFNIKRNLYLQTYTGEIEYENENFQPYEYLPFIESKSYRKFLEENKNNII
jgi:hypothetical protein